MRRFWNFRGTVAGQRFAKKLLWIAGILAIIGTILLTILCITGVASIEFRDMSSSVQPTITPVPTTTATPVPTVENSTPVPTVTTSMPEPTWTEPDTAYRGVKTSGDRIFIP